jgi:hypothetical protein
MPCHATWSLCPAVALAINSIVAVTDATNANSGPYSSFRTLLLLLLLLRILLRAAYGAADLDGIKGMPHHQLSNASHGASSEVLRK